jgi:4-hydroxybenzoate polyprenyltransferase
MPDIKSIILLSRPINLVIIAVTMGITRWVVLSNLVVKSNAQSLPLSTLHFLLLVAAAMLIAAAGNIINDYFDQRADKINKPQKVRIGRTVNRKVAILIHQGLNATGLALVFWVGLKNGYLLLLILPLLIALLLWAYSPLFKKKPLVGNLLVAFCTAAVPVFAVAADVHLIQHSQLISSGMAYGEIGQTVWPVILGISAFAFVLSMIREAVKDVEDEPGDRSELYQTIPILWGMKRTKRYVIGWIIVFLLMAALLTLNYTSLKDTVLILSLLVLPALLALYLVVQAKVTGDFSRVSLLIKLIMLCGLILMVMLPV